MQTKQLWGNDLDSGNIKRMDVQCSPWTSRVLGLGCWVCITMLGFFLTSWSEASIASCPQTSEKLFFPPEMLRSEELGHGPTHILFCPPPSLWIPAERHGQLFWVSKLQMEDCGTSWHPQSHEPFPIITAVCVCACTRMYECPFTQLVQLALCLSDPWPLSTQTSWYSKKLIDLLINWDKGIQMCLCTWEIWQEQFYVFSVIQNCTEKTREARAT